MKYDPNKMWQYPVLRPESDDYPTSEFQATIVVERLRDSTALQIQADFALGDTDLCKLIDDRRAQYTVVTRCSKTYFRQMDFTFDEKLIFNIPSDRVFGEVELSPYIIAIEEISNFRASSWHSDYDSTSCISLTSGSVIALDLPMRYHIDNAEELPVNSILEVRSGKPENGQWDCDLDAERVQIIMSEEDHEKFCHARQEAASKQEQAYILNSIYFPVVYHILVTADSEGGAYTERRWFRALDQRLEEVKAASLGKNGGNRLQDAQRLLENPFSRLPFIASDTL